MKIFICCSKYLYSKIPPIKDFLEERGHQVTLPNSYEDPMAEEKMKQQGIKIHAEWKGNMIKLQKEKIMNNEAIIVLNMEKNGGKDYIGGATFLEMFKAWELNKKIFLYGDIPEGILKDEINAFSPILLKGDLTRIVE